VNRRGYLGAVAGGAAALTGCLGNSGETGPSGDGGGSGSDGRGETDATDGTAGGSGGATPAGTPVRDHPAAAGLDDQPRLGELGDDRHVLIAFEDPSCTRCRAFERDVLPRITGDLVDPGKAAFVYRNYPVVYAWGKPAVQALEATFARDEGAFWSLKDYYFANQDRFGRGGIGSGSGGEDPLEGARRHLAAETELDADAVVADAEAKTYDDAVQADLDAGKAAGAGATTPTVFLFRNGRYLTRTSGTVSYDLIAASLGE
jgi:protein-disulfide isomerase